MMNINWNEVWKEMLCESFSNRPTEEKTPYAGYWDTPEQAWDYLKNYGIESDAEGRRIDLLNRLKLAPGHQVLEIGPCPGVLTLLIARQVSHVTAVEPSEGMSSVLLERLETENITNVTLMR